MPGKKHTSEYKREVIDYALTSSKTVKQICKEFNISYATYYKWKREILGTEENDRSDSEEVIAGSKLEMADQIRQLRKELAASQRREEILKKAAIILGEAPPNNMK